MIKNRRHPLHLAPYVACPSCGLLFVTPNALVKAYLTGQSVICSDCKTLVVAWDVVLSAIRKNHMYTEALIQFGAHSTSIEILMQPQQVLHLKLSDYGIPVTSRILSVNYSPNSSSDHFIFPLQIHSNQISARLIQNEISLYPSVLGAKSWGVETRISVRVIWIAPFVEEPLWNSLFEACENYVACRYSNCILPANVAVEAKLNGFMIRYFSQRSSENRATKFLRKGAPYTDQLNIILPCIARKLNFLALPDVVNAGLNRLRDLRNEIAHDGMLSSPLEDVNAAELICAALFGFQYIQLLDFICE